MAFKGTFEDRLLIRERINTYSDAAFQCDKELWLANWIEDCTWHALGREFRGKSELRAQWSKIWESMERMAFFTEVGAIDVEGDRAKARCYCREILFFKDGSIRKIVGQYDDKLVRENGEWLFAERSYTVLMTEG